MCTAITYQTKDFYFGRNLDLEYGYNEVVTLTPRNYPFHFRNGTTLDAHYALIGMTAQCSIFPLYYEATNEKGLSIAGLSFPGLAVYYPQVSHKKNIAPFELIPWVLGQCATLEEALIAIQDVNLWDQPFNSAFPLTPLHWIVSDSSGSVTLEPLSDGLRIHGNPVGVLTNSPTFDYHMYHLADYLNLTAQPPVSRFSPQITLKPYSLGMGSIGLPGDMSSGSRFVRAAFTKLNSNANATESESVSQFFHILASVAQPNGLTCVGDGKYEITRYSSCCNVTQGIYYYTTYENSQITAINMHHEDLDAATLMTFPQINKQQINYQN